MQGRMPDKTDEANYQLLDKLIPNDNFLKKINNIIDFNFIDKVTEACYCPNNGRPSLAPELFFRIILVGYIYDIKSTRQLMEHIRYNLSYRWFCGLTLNDTIPHHATLSRIKKRFSTDIFEQFFDAIVNQCQKAGLLNSQSIMTDSTLIQAKASLNSMKPINDMGSKNRRPNENGIVEKDWQISNKTHRSTSDPDATLAFKKGTLRGLKYKAHVCCDSESRVIAAIKITTGAVHDSQPYIGLLNQVKNKSALIIREVIADRAYGSGEILSSLQNAGMRFFMPLFTTRSGNNQYSNIPGTHYSAEKKTYICPANIELRAGKLNSEGFIAYRTSTKDCKNCGIRADCQIPQEKGRETRKIAMHIHADIFQQVKLEMETEEFKKKMRERLWKIEGVMNELKNYHNLSRAKVKGLGEVQIQAYMAAIAINIKRLVFFATSFWVLLYLKLDQSLIIFYNRPVPFLSQTI